MVFCIKKLPNFRASSTVLADLLILQIPLSGYHPRVHLFGSVKNPLLG